MEKVVNITNIHTFYPYPLISLMWYSSHTLRRLSKDSHQWVRDRL